MARGAASRQVTTDGSDEAPPRKIVHFAPSSASLHVFLLVPLSFRTTTTEAASPHHVTTDGKDNNVTFGILDTAHKGPTFTISFLLASPTSLIPVTAVPTSLIPLTAVAPALSSAALSSSFALACVTGVSSRVLLSHRALGAQVYLDASVGSPSRVVLEGNASCCREFGAYLALRCCMWVSLRVVRSVPGAASRPHARDLANPRPRERCSADRGRDWERDFAFFPPLPPRSRVSWPFPRPGALVSGMFMVAGPPLVAFAVPIAPHPRGLAKMSIDSTASRAVTAAGIIQMTKSRGRHSSETRQIQASSRLDLVLSVTWYGYQEVQS